MSIQGIRGGAPIPGAGAARPEPSAGDTAFRSVVEGPAAPEAPAAPAEVTGAAPLDDLRRGAIGASDCAGRLVDGAMQHLTGLSAGHRAWIREALAGDPAVLELVAAAARR